MHDWTKVVNIKNHQQHLMKKIKFMQMETRRAPKERKPKQIRTAASMYMESTNSTNNTHAHIAHKLPTAYGIV